MKNLEIYNKEIFIKNFCKKRGWNPEELSTNQMLVIVKEYEIYKKI